MSFNAKFIDSKWQKIWKSKGAFKADDFSSKPKYYVLDMFPYPSGSGLHVGHLIGYTATDVIARLKRLEGFNVLHPMGWDSFGLPAEQYAMKNNKHPALITKENVNNFKRQLNSVGFSYDWSREIFTSDPSYYKWTQFIFSEMYRRDLAYIEEHDVNYCPALKTVLAKEEVINGKSKDGGHEVVQQKRKQWVLKITKYADRLLNGLDSLDWPDSIKDQQRNWICRMDGASLDLDLGEDKINAFCPCKRKIKNSVLLVIPDEFETLEGREFFVTDKVAKNDSLGIIVKLVVSNYAKEKYGVSNYLMALYSNSSDDSFIRKVCEEYEINDASLSDDELELLENKKILFCEKRYKIRDWVFARQRYWGEPMPILHLSNGEKRALEKNELPLLLPKIPMYSTEDDSYLSPLDRDLLWMEVLDLVTGLQAKKDPNTMPQWAGSCWYYLRFMDPNNDKNIVGIEKERYWGQVDMYVGGAEHAVLHLLYARFWHKFLYDINIVTNDEPFASLKNQGLVYANAYVDKNRIFYEAEEIEKINDNFFVKRTGDPVEEVYEKMSKSKMNGVSPDKLIEKFGADAVRMYVLFMGPFDQPKKFESNAVVGCKRFLNKIFSEIEKIEIKEDELSIDIINTSNEIKRMISLMKFNVAISEAMKLLNRGVLSKPSSSKSIKSFLAIMSTMAPHIMSELWEMKKFHEDINTYRIERPVEQVFERIGIQVHVNGKFITKISIEPNLLKNDVYEIATDNEDVAKKISGKCIKNIIFVKGKLINILC